MWASNLGYYGHSPSIVTMLSIELHQGEPLYSSCECLSKELGWDSSHTTLNSLAPSFYEYYIARAVVPDGGHVKQLIVSLDDEGYSAVSEELEGGHLTQFGLTKWMQTLKLIPSGENASKLHICAEYEGGSEESVAKSGEISLQGLNTVFKAVEGYVKSSV